MKMLKVPISSTTRVTILSITIILTFTTTFTKGQYETPNHICGGYFKSVTGSIQFKYNGTSNLTEHVCAWTVSGSLPSQYSRYDITIQQINGFACNSLTTKVAVSHFNVWAQTVTATETWSCTGPQLWRAVPGTVFIVVWKTTALQTMSGFQLDWKANGERIDRGGVRTTAYSWGKPDLGTLPYYASGFFKEEVATHVFPKGNNTDGYALEIQFETIIIDECGGVNAPCTENNSTMLILSIDEDATLQVRNRYTGNETYPPSVSSPWGMVILVWAGDFWGAGGRFQMVYRSIRV